MNRRTKRKIKRFLWMTWEWVKVVAVVLFAMAAGAACYHQYLAQHHMLRTERQATVQLISSTQIVRAMAAVKEEPEPIEQSYIMTPEEIAEEEKTDELELIAICVEAEAGNQSLTGKRMVADVILNRVDDPDFPDTIQGVISQKYHFSSYWDGGMDRVVEPSEETILAVQMELQERGWPGLLYFTAGEWPEYGTPWKKVGDHYFATK